MAHLIDKDALVKEMQRLSNEWRLLSSTEAKYRREVYTELLSFINTLEVKEPASEDLEQAAESAVLSVFTGYADTNTPFRAEKIAMVSKIFKAGIEWQKEQMMKDAIEGWVARDECGDIAIFSDKPYRDLGLGMWTPARHAFLFPRKDEYPDVTWNSEPQKVKVIIIKE